MLRKILLSLFMLFIFMGVTFAQELRVNNKLVQEGDNLNLFFDDLDAGRIVFSIASEDYKKAEITLDKGRTWLPMQEERGYFVYGYHPLSNEVFFPEMLLTDKDKGVQIFRPNLRINYQKEKPDAQLIQLLEKFKTFYENENSDRFLSLFASRYPNLVKFDQAIQNDFYNYKNIRLFYRIDTRAFDDDLEGAIWNVYWQRNYQDRNGNDLTETSANIAMRFDKESGNWQITGLRNNTIFGSSLLVSVATADPVLEISPSDITQAVGASPYNVNVVVHNTGNAAASNIVINFYRNLVFVNTKTIANIAAGSTGTTTCDYSSGDTGPANVKVDIDPDNLITSADPTKKTATKSITF